MRRFLSGLVIVFVGTLPVAGQAAATPSPAPGPQAAAVHCAALYQPVGAKVPGEPTLLGLRGYQCGKLAASIAGPVVLKVYEHIDYGGDSLELRVAVDCDSDGYRWDSMPDGWNDRVSSFRSYYNCRGVRLYEHNGTSGRCGTYVYDASWIGDEMNDKTSSVRNSRDYKNFC